MTSSKPNPSWYVYMLECAGQRIYTGIAVDVDKRFLQHATGKGARFTRSFPPVRILMREAHPDRSTASKSEYAIKQLSASAKRVLARKTSGPA